MVGCCNHHGVWCTAFWLASHSATWSYTMGGSGEHVVVKGSLGDGDEVCDAYGH